MFLVAVPLCVGIAVASGVPAELGLVTGIVGGLVAGAMPGSSLQVSGPAAGLTVLVYEAVTTHGVAALGILVLATGLLQVGLGLVGFGRWFRAISTAVVHGMLAGIELVPDQQPALRHGRGERTRERPRQPGRTATCSPASPAPRRCPPRPSASAPSPC
ncbi:hypothetical protein SCALM49S_09006 [Streptomyces californicus]